jgi:hypothetical protein
LLVYINLKNSKLLNKVNPNVTPSKAYTIPEEPNPLPFETKAIQSKLENIDTKKITIRI